MGSNAIRLLIADIIIEDGENTTFKKKLFIRIPLRLGDDAFLNKNISDQKVKDLIRTMTAFSHLMKVFNVQHYRACATSAMREASNGLAIVDKIKSKARLNLEIINGQQEANIIYTIHEDQHLQPKKNCLYIDVGGGSTQLSLFADGKMISSNSFNIGTIRILGNQVTDEHWDEMKEWITEKLSVYKKIIGIGTGGNINKLHQMANKKNDKPLDYEDIKKLNDELTSYSLEERIHKLHLNADRADVIIPASEIYLNVMKWATIDHLLVPRLGLVDGIIQQLIEKYHKK